MKKIFLIMLVLISSNLFAETVKIKVKGMVCAFCANGLEKKFNKLEGLESVKVSLDDKLITSKFKGNTAPNDEKIKKLVTDAGYNVAGIEREK